jgi:hypothetical protein
MKISNQCSFLRFLSLDSLGGSKASRSSAAGASMVIGCLCQWDANRRQRKEGFVGWGINKHGNLSLVGGLEHFLFSIIYGIILPIDSYFSRWLKHV